MPDKRQESKQRRAARNRANREALAARRDNVLSSPAPRSSTSSATPGAPKAGTPSGTDPRPAAGAAAPPPRGLLGQLRSGRPGDVAVLVALLLAVLGAVLSFFMRVRVDARGEPWPLTFEAVAKEAQRVMGEQVPDRTVSLLDAYGAQVPLLLALPIAVTVFAVWANRRPDRSRLLTFALFGMFAAVTINRFVNLLHLVAVVALAVASFRVRKADMPARIAERAVARQGRGSSGGGFGGFGGFGGRGRGKVIDADSAEVADTDASAADAPADDAPADSGAPGADPGKR